MENAKPGHSVQFHGLKGAAHLNGTQGHLIQFLKKEQRWSVRCDDDDQVQVVVKAKPENLKRINTTTTTEKRSRAPASRAPAPDASSSQNTADSLLATLLASYHERRMGGAVISCGNKYMVAVEFNGPCGHGGHGIDGDMVYVDKDPLARSVVQRRGCARATELGSNFLMGETVEYIETMNEGAFSNLLNKLKRFSSTQGYIDIKSGLPLHSVRISK
uniref:Uncharacterized protein n=1 Tax=Chaetoceros debilis TaxID=122233 RepID=A0A7S3VG69_9STRA|mmetsp:Transcript_13981/g.20880  ORF Transcript_13981/g.20880 Transcript_13981/m.20880 type:complete len:217 (+) Transcript_13981:52-702(+)